MGGIELAGAIRNIDLSGSAGCCGAAAQSSNPPRPSSKRRIARNLWLGVFLYAGAGSIARAWTHSYRDKKPREPRLSGIDTPTNGGGILRPEQHFSWLSPVDVLVSERLRKILRVSFGGQRFTFWSCTCWQLSSADRICSENRTAAPWNAILSGVGVGIPGAGPATSSSGSWSPPWHRYWPTTPWRCQHGTHWGPALDTY